MLPSNIYNMVEKLLEMTRAGQVRWDFDYNNDKASASLIHFAVDLFYVFDGDTGLSYIYVDYFDKATRQQYRFTTSSDDSHFNITKLLYDEAQSSTLNIRF